MKGLEIRLLFIMHLINKTILALYDRVYIYSRLLVSLLLCLFCKVKKGRIVLWSTTGKDYSCNPLYISNYLLDYEMDTFEVYWLYKKNLDKSVFDSRIKAVRFGSIMHLYVMQTAEFLVTNHRTSTKAMLWIKRAKQKYIMTWHGSMALKKIEKDAIKSLGSHYEKFARKDSANCSLMLSDSEWFSHLLRNSFWYDGEILQEGMPRNDIFYYKEKHANIRNKVSKELSISNNSDKIIVLYAPTFRTDHSTSQYILKWGNIKAKIESILKKDVVFLMRLHPTLLDIVDTSELISESFVRNASSYDNIQELLIASDILITDYSSTMFEFALLGKPCFLFTPDVESYDRGFYFPIGDLPFPSSLTEDSLVNRIISFNSDSYYKNVDSFMSRTFNVKGDGHACERVVLWMKKHSS